MESITLAVKRTYCIRFAFLLAARVTSWNGKTYKKVQEEKRDFDQIAKYGSLDFSVPNPPSPLLTVQIRCIPIIRTRACKNEYRARQEFSFNVSLIRRYEISRHFRILFDSRESQNILW